MIKSSDG